MIIGAEADGVGPSVLLTCAGSQRQYLFGAAEGFSRLALECRARPTAKLRAVFLSSFRPRASGGLGGLLLRLCADGHKSVCLAGPPGVGTHVEALRDFVRFRHPEVTALRLVPPGLARRDVDVFAPDDTRACDAAAESYRDDAVMVFPLFAPSGAGPDAFETCRVCAAVDEASSDDSSSDDSSSDEASSDEANAPSLKRARSDEASRSSRSSSDERSRRDVIGYACAIRDDDARVSATFLVLDCADDADARAAAGNATVRCCMRGQCGKNAKNEKHPRACAAFHLTPRDVASRPAYDAVRRRADDAEVPKDPKDPKDPKEEKHIEIRVDASVLHVDCSVAGEVGFRAGARTLARLHAVDPDTFPLSPSLRAPYRAPEPDLRSDPKTTTRGSRAAPPAGRRGDVRSAVGSLCATVTLFRARNCRVGGYASMDQRSNRAPELDVDAIVSKALPSRARAAEDENENAEDHENERRRTSSAAAVILAGSGGFSLCYSGDCRPSRRLAAAARGVQVLVHEATFADDLLQHAERKRHSTVSEALRVSGDARAGATILTHFSQRYPKAVGRVGDPREGKAEENGEKRHASDGSVACAFDGMRVRWDALGKLTETARAVDAALEAAEVEAAEARGEDA